MIIELRLIPVIEIKVIIKEGQHLVWDTAVFRVDIINMCTNVFFSKMFDPYIFKPLAEHHTLRSKAVTGIPAPVELNGFQLLQVVKRFCDCVVSL